MAVALRALVLSCPRAVLVLAALASLGVRDVARAADGVLRVEFLYAIESAGGRGERLRDPIDVSLDRKTGEIYVVDAGANKVLVYDRNGTFAQAIPVPGDPPGMAAVDGQGRLYVGHLRSGKISLFDFQGTPLRTIALPEVPDLPGAAVRPVALAAGAAGEVFALKKAGGIVKIDPEGESTEEIGISGEEKPNAIYGVTVDRAGRFLFTDMRPYSVVVFDPKTRESKRFGQAGVLYGQLDRPIGVAADGTGHIFVVSTVTNKVSCFGPNGEFLEEFGAIGKQYGQFYMPSRIASDGGDRIYVLENALKRVQVFRVEFLREKGVTRSTHDPAQRKEPSQVAVAPK